MPSRISVKTACILLIAASLAACAATPVRYDKRGERWAQATLRRMTLEEKVGQMMMGWAHAQFLNVEDPEYQKLRQELREYHVGGFGVTIPTENGALVKSWPLETAALTNGLQRASKYPLMMAADFERGPSMRLNGATDFPAAMAFGAADDPKLAREFGRIAAQEARAVGIQWNWFPVADVNSNPANPVINTRSFGEAPAKVGEMIAAYVEGARAAGMLTTAKHFPGHGDTDTDSHIGLARVTGDRAHLDATELVPFRRAIAAGADSIMVGHLTVPAIETEANKPASVSKAVITDLLRKELGFKGLIVTDALDMGALMHEYTGTDAEISAKQAVDAVLAGNDMVIIPADLGGAYHGLLNAVRDGRIPRARIDQSVLRILRMKAAVGLDRMRTVDLGDVQREVRKPANQAFANDVASRAVTLAVDAKNLVPLEQPLANSVAVLFTDTPMGTDGSRALQYDLRTEARGMRVLRVDNGNAAYIADDVLKAVRKAERVVVIAESFPSPYRIAGDRSGGSAGLESGPLDLVRKIVSAAGDKTVVAAFGNPYTGAEIPGVKSYLCTFSNTQSSAHALVRALMGRSEIHGRLPVTIAGIGKRGAGLDREVATPAK